MPTMKALGLISKKLPGLKPPGPNLSLVRPMSRTRSLRCSALLLLLLLWSWRHFDRWERRLIGTRHVVGLERALLVLPHAEFDVDLLEIAGLAAARIHLRNLDAQLLGHLLAPEVLSFVDGNVTESPLGVEELQLTVEPRRLADHEGLLVVVLLRDAHRRATHLAHSICLQGGLTFLVLLLLDVELNLLVLLQEREAVDGIDGRPEDEHLVVRCEILLVQGEETIAVQLPVLLDYTCVDLFLVELEVVGDDLGNSGALLLGLAFSRSRRRGLPLLARLLLLGHQLSLLGLRRDLGRSRLGLRGRHCWRRRLRRHLVGPHEADGHGGALGYGGLRRVQRIRHLLCLRHLARPRSVVLWSRAAAFAPEATAAAAAAAAIAHLLLLLQLLLRIGTRSGVSGRLPRRRTQALPNVDGPLLVLLPGRSSPSVTELLLLLLAIAILLLAITRLPKALSAIATVRHGNTKKNRAETAEVLRNKKN